MWKVVGRHLFLNTIPNNFLGRTGWKVWCDQGMSLVFREKLGTIGQDPNVATSKSYRLSYMLHLLGQ
jgi:hypothetical protein